MADLATRILRRREALSTKEREELQEVERELEHIRLGITPDSKHEVPPLNSARALLDHERPLAAMEAAGRTAHALTGIGLPNPPDTFINRQLEEKVFRPQMTEEITRANSRMRRLLDRRDEILRLK